MHLHTPPPYPRNIPLGAILGLPPVPLDLCSEYALYAAVCHSAAFGHLKEAPIVTTKTIRGCRI
jgi:hypothetical protein